MARAGGDTSGRERELQLLRFQVAELDAARLAGPGEEEELAAEEDTLTMAAAHRSAAEAAYQGLAGDDEALDRVGQVVAALSGHAPLVALHARLRGLVAELADAAAEARQAAETLEEDPQRLAEVVARRTVLRDLRRKYAGHGAGLDGVIAFRARAAERLAELEGLGTLAARLAGEHADASAELRRAATELGEVRRAAAGMLGPAVEGELRRLAMPRARFEVQVGGSEGGIGPGDAELAELSGDGVTFLLAANPGEPLLPLSRVASGGELARAMLALRLALLSGGAKSGAGKGPQTLVFDEVDAGVGGEAALAVGRALARLGRHQQVIVVTHLAQVAAYAGAQVAVSKVERDGRTVATARIVDGPDRVVELSRMLSGQPNSQSARRHAEELLVSARTDGPGRRPSSC